MPNLWRQFQSLLPDEPRLIGTVSVTHADGSKTVTLLDGGLLRVRGDGGTGERVFVRAGRIEGPAPALPHVDIEI